MKQRIQSALSDWFCLWLVMIMLGSSWAAEIATNYWTGEATASNGPVYNYGYVTNWVMMLPVKEKMVIVTNVTEKTNERGCSTCKALEDNPGLCIYHPFHLGGLPYVPATEKLTTTIVKEVYTLELEWRGKPWTQTDEKVLSKTYKKIALSNTWIDVEPNVADTNENAIMLYWGTNAVLLTPDSTNLWFYPSSNWVQIGVMTNMILTATNNTIDVLGK